MSRIAELNRKATQLTQQLNLARKMGETADANSFRQQLATVRQEVNAETLKLQGNGTTPQTPATATPAATPQSTPFGLGAKPQTPAFVGPVAPSPLQTTFGLKPTTPSPASIQATDLLKQGVTPKDIATKLNLPMTDAEKNDPNLAVPESVQKLLGENGWKVQSSTAGANGETRQTTFANGGSDPLTTKGGVKVGQKYLDSPFLNGGLLNKPTETITINQDFHTGDSYATSTKLNGPGAPEQSSGPLRDGLGRTKTSGYDPKAQTITTTYKDDLGLGAAESKGQTTETVSFKDDRSQTTAVTGADGKLVSKVHVDADGVRTLLGGSDKSIEQATRFKDAALKGDTFEQIATRENSSIKDGEKKVSVEDVKNAVKSTGVRIESTTTNGVETNTLLDPVSNSAVVETVENGQVTRKVITGTGTFTFDENGLPTADGGARQHYAGQADAINKKAGQQAADIAQTRKDRTFASKMGETDEVARLTQLLKTQQEALDRTNADLEKAEVNVGLFDAGATKAVADQTVTLVQNVINTTPPGSERHKRAVALLPGVQAYAKAANQQLRIAKLDIDIVNAQQKYAETEKALGDAETGAADAARKRQEAADAKQQAAADQAAQYAEIVPTTSLDDSDPAVVASNSANDDVLGAGREKAQANSTLIGLVQQKLGIKDEMLAVVERGLPDGAELKNIVAGERKTIAEQQDALGNLRTTAMNEADFNNFMLGQEDRNDVDELPGLLAKYADSRPEQIDATNIYRMGKIDELKDKDINTRVENALAGSGDVNLVAGKIREIGGPDAKVNIIPFTHTDSASGVRNTALFEVTAEDGSTKIVTDDGGVYYNFTNWHQDNKLSDDGSIYVAKKENGRTIVSKMAAHETTTEEVIWRIADVGATVVGVAAAGVLVVGTGGMATPLVAAAFVAAGGTAVYGGVRGGMMLVSESSHGYSINPLSNPQALQAWLMVAGSVLPAGGIGAGSRATSLLGRAAGLRAEAALAQQGAASATDDAARLAFTNTAKSNLAAAGKLEGGAKRWSLAALGLNHTATGVGTYMVGDGAVNLAMNYEHMSGLDFAESLLQVGGGAAAIGLGVAGSRRANASSSELNGEDGAVTNPVGTKGAGGDDNVVTTAADTSNATPAVKPVQADADTQNASTQNGQPAQPNSGQPAAQNTVSPLKLSKGQDRKVGRSLNAADKAEAQATTLRDKAEALQTTARDAAGKVEQLKTEYQTARTDPTASSDLSSRLSELPGLIKKAQTEASKARRNADQNIPKLEKDAAKLELKAEGLRQTPMGKNFIGRDKNLLGWINPDLADPAALKQYKAAERDAAKAFDKLDTASTKLENAKQQKTVAEAEVAQLTQARSDASTPAQRLKAAAKLHRAEERVSKLDYKIMDLTRRVRGLRQDFGDQLVGLRDMLGYAPEAAVPAQNGRPAMAARPGKAGVQDNLNLVSNEAQRLIDAGTKSRQDLVKLKTGLDKAEETFAQATLEEKTARDANAGVSEVRGLASRRVSAERAFREKQAEYRQALKDDFSAAKISAEARALKDAVEKINWQDPQGRNLLPKLNVGKITLGILASHVGGNALDSTAGTQTVSKVLGSNEANTANYARSAASKNAWRGHNHSSIRAFDLAAHGDGVSARKMVENIISRAPYFGAKRLGRKQAHDFRTDLQQVAEAGKAYQDARASLPAELRNAFPEPDIRLESSFDPKKSTSRAPEPKDLAGVADRLIADDPAFAGQNQDAVVQDLTTKLTQAETSYQQLDAALRNTLNKFPAAVRGYKSELGKLPPELQKLLPDVQDGLSVADARGLAKPDTVTTPDKAVFEKYAADNNVEAGPLIKQFEKAKKQYGEIDKAANGKVDYKAAEKYPTSSMAPNTPIGLGFKSASFGFNFNGLLGWLSKHTPGSNVLGWGNHAGFAGHMIVGSIFQAKYLRALRAVDDFNEAKPYAKRTDEEHKVFDSLDAERKKWNTRNDLAGFASAARSILQGAAFWKAGMHEAAIASWVQGLTSMAWVETQQGSISRFVSKASSLGKKDTYKGQGPEIPFTWKSEWNPQTGEFGRKARVGGNKWPQPEGEARQWSNKTKTAMRWASIATGLAVPTLLYLATSGQLDKMLNSDDFWQQKMTLPSNGDPSALEAGWDVISTIFAGAADFAAIDQADMSDDLMAATSDGTNQLTDDEQLALSSLVTMSGILAAGQQRQGRQIPAAAIAPDAGLPLNWISPDYAQLSADRAREGGGRRNARLDGDPRFGSVSVDLGDSLRNSMNRILRAKNADAAETVLLNMEHIPDPSQLRAGDRIYFPLV